MAREQPVRDLRRFSIIFFFNFGACRCLKSDPMTSSHTGPSDMYPGRIPHITAPAKCRENLGRDAINRDTEKGCSNTTVRSLRRYSTGCMYCFVVLSLLQREKILRRHSQTHLGLVWSSTYIRGALLLPQQACSASALLYLHDRR